MSYINNLHISHEVVEGAERAKTLSKAFSSDNRYAYKADAILIGYAPLEPFMPVYLEGLQDGMSGVWVAITVNHVFNVGIPYSLQVHLGTNKTLLSLAKPANAVHVTVVNQTVQPEITPESETLMHFSQKKTGGYYYEYSDLLPIPIENNHFKGSTYDPVADYLTQSSTEPFTTPSIYNLYTPSVNLVKEAKWSRKS
jgi:hypothetical protein